MVFFVTSCEEGPTKIGSDLLPGSDFVNIKSIDTISVKSYTMYDDSIRTDNSSVSYLGQIYDPYFGTTTANFVTQIRMGSKWDGLSYTVDSVKLFLSLLDVEGGTNVTHSISISEISDQLDTDSAYYSNKPVPLTGWELTNIDLPQLQADTINNIVVRIPVDFGNYLIRDTSKLFYSNTKSDFRSYFKGIYFQMDPSPDPLLVSLTLQLSSTSTGYSNRFVLYMHDIDGLASEFYFILDAVNRNASFNRFSHNFSTASLGNKMLHRNTTYKDTLSYLQYLNGVYIKISLPGLENLKNDPSFDNIAVNKVRLTVPVYLDGDLYKTTTVPSSLFLRYKTNSGTKYVVPDYNIDTYHSFFDGTLDTTALVYNFNIPSFVQGYLEDDKNNIQPELEIFQGTGTKNVILKANNNKTPVKFQFTYTKF
ncbi:MAG: DUF4270 family protein [Bacteroidota bacterium]